MPGPKGVALSLRGLSRRFGSQWVVDGLNLRIPAGQFLALLGPSGCGKTTLLRLIAGLERPDQGSIALAGEEHAKAYVFQDPCLLPWRRVLANVALPLELMGVPKAERLEMARQLTLTVGLGAAQDLYPDALSGGMRMRVSLARALVTQPRLLLLDEPFAALDEFTRQYLDDHLQALFLARPMTVIFVTHSIAEAVYLADRVVMLTPRGGGIALDLDVDLPRPRERGTRFSPAYLERVRRLSAALTNGEAQGEIGGTAEEMAPGPSHP